jgi:hypothetical protein
MTISMSVRRAIFHRRLNTHQSGHVVSTSKSLPAFLKCHVAAADEATARKLERYFKSGSGKAFAKKRFMNSSQ